MRRAQRCHVENFAVGGQAPVEIVAIPGGKTLLAIVDVLLRYIDPPGNDVRFADPVGSPTLWHGVAHGDDAGTRRDTIPWVDAAGEVGAIGQRKAYPHGRCSACRAQSSQSPSIP